MLSQGTRGHRSCIFDGSVPLVQNLVRAYIKTEWRGSTRCAFLLARHVSSLQAVPIMINGSERLFVDLRDGISHQLVAGSPWAAVPWECDEQIVMRRLVRDADVVFDIGAHIGLHMVLLSDLVGPNGVVHAFEVNPMKIATLHATSRDLPNTIVHAFGVSDRYGRVSLFVPEDDESMASLRDWTEGRIGAVRRCTCEVAPIDELIAKGVLPQPGFVKCDVEGAEMLVFAGALHCLDREEAPVILYEANLRSARAFGVPISAATDFLRTLKAPAYSFFHVQPGGRLVPFDAFHDDCDHYNLIAAPRARLDRLAPANR